MTVRVGISVQNDQMVVHAERGDAQKADIVLEISKGGCVNLRTGGVQKSENFADVLNGWPLSDQTNPSDTTIIEDKIAKLIEFAWKNRTHLL